MLSLDRNILLALRAVKGIGSRTLHRIVVQLTEKQISLKTFWESKEAAWKDCVLNQAQIASLKKFQKSYSPQSYAELLESKGIQVVFHFDISYPVLLAQTPGAPFVLFVRGSTEFWNHLPIAVVGARRVTSYGEYVTKTLTTELVHSGSTIISGFMYGVDMLAHQTALRLNGKSVGVLGFGFNYMYPSSLRQVADEFLAAGNTLITELAPEVPPSKGNFPARNRIVAGLSQATIVTEAAADSGSLLTANWAKKYQRLVCAVPGPITNIYSEGTKKLLNEGAKIISSGTEVMKYLGRPTTQGSFLPREPQTNNSLEEKILCELRNGQTSLDGLGKQLQRPITELGRALTYMELRQVIKRKGAQWYPN